jgi:glycosyltransferase involved in cell wall biosynthesis
VRFADEILVVDSFSTDRTLEIARRHTNRILQHEFQSHGAQNNWALPHASHEWVLVVDADERVTPELAEEIRGVLREPDCDGYWIRRRNFFLGKEILHGTWSADKVLRLFRRDKGKYEEKPVHSKVVLNGRAGHCREALLHYTYQSVDDWLRKIHRFSTGGAISAMESGAPSSGWYMFSRACARVLKSYVFKCGFLDGTEGLIIAFMQGYVVFVKYAKLYEMRRKAKT